VLFDRSKGITHLFVRASNPATIQQYYRISKGGSISSDLFDFDQNVSGFQAYFGAGLLLDEGATVTTNIDVPVVPFARSVQHAVWESATSGPGTFTAKPLPIPAGETNKTDCVVQAFMNINALVPGFPGNLTIRFGGIKVYP
jgi:hypothetical protein